MYRLKRQSFSLLALALLSLIFLSGCWGSHELTDEFIVLGIGIDKVDDHIRLTMQTIQPEKAIGGGGGGAKDTQQGTESSFFLISGEGRTIDEARKMLSRRAPRMIYGGHNLALFLGEDLARDGILPYIDYFARYRLSQDSMWLVIARGKAEDVLTITNVLAKSSAMSLIDLVKKRELHIPTLYDYLLKFQSDSNAQVLASAKTVPNNNVAEGFEMDQLLMRPNALMCGDKLVGFLPETDAETYNWLTQGFKNTTDVVKHSKSCPDGMVGIRLRGKPAKMKLVSEGNEHVFKIDVHADFSMAEQTCACDITSPESIKELEEALNEEATRKIQAVVELTQREKLDIFGLADYIHAHHPKTWQVVQADWPDIYAELPVQINVETHLRDTGMVTKSISIKSDQP